MRFSFMSPTRVNRLVAGSYVSVAKDPKLVYEPNTRTRPSVRVMEVLPSVRSAEEPFADNVIVPVVTVTVDDKVAVVPARLVTVSSNVVVVVKVRAID